MHCALFTCLPIDDIAIMLLLMTLQHLRRYRQNLLGMFHPLAYAQE